MNIWFAVILIVTGVALVVFSAGKLTRAAVGTSYGFGMTPFLVSVIFLGFDPENLAVGVAGAYESVEGIAIGSIIGAAMVAYSLAFGITALIVPMRFEKAPNVILGVPVAAVLLFGFLSLDGALSRLDGACLLGGYVVAIAYLVWLHHRRIDVEAATKPRERKIQNRWKATGLLLLALVAIVVGSEMLVEGSKTVIELIGISDTFYGMAILALLVSVEEIARELPAALHGHPEISFGNVVGAALAFFLFNAGIIALVRNVKMDSTTLRFYVPLALASVVMVTVFVAWKTVPRWGGAVLVALYGIFVVGGYVLGQTGMPAIMQ